MWAGLTDRALPEYPYPLPDDIDPTISQILQSMVAVEEPKNPSRFGLDDHYERENAASNSRIAAVGLAIGP
jgi:hypothetical protein